MPISISKTHIVFAVWAEIKLQNVKHKHGRWFFMPKKTPDSASVYLGWIQAHSRILSLSAHLCQRPHSPNALFSTVS